MAGTGGQHSKHPCKHVMVCTFNILVALFNCGSTPVHALIVAKQQDSHIYTSDYLY